MTSLLSLGSTFTMLAQDYNGAGAAGGIISSLFCCVFAGLGLALFAFWLWMLIDCIQRDFPGSKDKIIWILVIVLLHWLGALIYFFVGRGKGVKG